MTASSWREPERLWLILIVFVGYFIDWRDPSLRGEETRWAQVASEILRTGDWLVPRQQGELFISRPPAGSWPMALLGLVRGDVDLFAVRFPSLVAILLLSLLTYWYARQFLPPLGALAAGAGFATMAQTLQLGRLAESEACFSFYLGGALLIWHGGHLRNPRAYWPWLTAYALLALATLTKGLQAPTYFGGAVGIYLLWTGQWRLLLCRQHFAGLAVFVLGVGAWVVPFTLTYGVQQLALMFGNDVAGRFYDASPGMVVGHLAIFPLELWAIMLPWSFALLLAFVPSVRPAFGSCRSQTTFLIIALAVAFPPVWIVPRGMTRYFMPMFPLVAVLCAIVFVHVVRTWRERTAYGVVLAQAGFMVLANLTVYLPIVCSRSTDTRGDVAEVKDIVGGEKLVSFGFAHHLFAYYYKEPIALLPWPGPTTVVPEDVRFFCYPGQAGRPTLPFAWREVKVVSCERSRRDHPVMTVVVGERIDEGQ